MRGERGSMSERVLTFLGRGDVMIVGSAIAAFLVLSWVLRGAAPGKAVEGEVGGEPSVAFLDLSLLAGVLIVLNVLAFRYGGLPLDLTREGTYSLTPETIARVKAL